MVGCKRSLRVGRDTGNLGLRLETTKVVKNCLKGTLITEVRRTKVPKKRDVSPFRLALFHIELPLPIVYLRFYCNKGFGPYLYGPRFARLHLANPIWNWVCYQVASFAAKIYFYSQ
jgi:hypothetical protein